MPVRARNKTSQGAELSAARPPFPVGAGRGAIGVGVEPGTCGATVGVGVAACCGAEGVAVGTTGAATTGTTVAAGVAVGAAVLSELRVRSERSLA